MNVALLAASWQLRLVTTGSLSENVVPLCVVLSVNGLGPFQAPVPVPSMTSSCVEMTWPVSASVITCSLLGIAPLWPVTTVS